MTSIAIKTPTGAALILCAAALWGTVGVVTRGLYAGEMTTPLSIAFFRFAFAALVMTIACLRLLGARRLLRVHPRDIGLMLLLGVLMAGNQSAYLMAIPLAGVTVSTLITICSAPLVVAALSALFKGQPLQRHTALAMGGGLLGALCLVVGGSDSSAANDLLLGALLALASAVGYACMILCGHSLTVRYHPLQINMVGFITGALVLLLVTLPAGLHLEYSAGGWLLLAYLGAFPSAAAYGLFLVGMRKTTATNASILVLAEPLTAALLAALLFGEQIGAFGWLGALLLCGSFSLLSRGE